MVGNRNILLSIFKTTQDFQLITEIPVISPPSINGSYIEGSSVNISCTATGKPDPEVSWIRNGQTKGSGSKTAYLNFNSIKRKDDGLYTCTAKNSAGTKSRAEILVVRCESELVLKFTSLLQSINSRLDLLYSSRKLSDICIPP